ncbi:MAG: type II secretion system protein [Clostridiales bacterium]|nr:type II secretion system protein [Clostridiales bacterium]
MKKTNKKGFTIIELVIVIAVIAILAAVLIPTFTSISNRAKESAALQEAKNALTIAYADAIADGYIDNADDKDNAQAGVQIKYGGFTFSYLDGVLVGCVADEDSKYEEDYTFNVENGVIASVVYDD